MASRVEEHQRIIAFRHVLVHGYYSLDAEIVWFVLSEKAPELARQVRGMINPGPA